MAPKTKNSKVQNSTVVNQVTTPNTETNAIQQTVIAPPLEVTATPEVIASEVTVPQKGGAKKGVKKATDKKATDKKASDKKAPNKKSADSEQQGVKKSAGKKQVQEKNSTNEEEEEEEDLKTRSFKVKLPGEDGFTGRFTGLTPYQAANKALSKYFRGLEVENNSQVNFSIRESTRGSKRHEYVYKGSRLKLDKPITYTIKSVLGDERVITKQYKNQLIKVKKGIVKQESASI